MRQFFQRMRRRLPWNRPTLADLPKEERRRAKAMILGAGAGAAMRPDEDGKLRIHVDSSGDPE